MYHNGLRYGRIAALVLFTHVIMLMAVLFRGNYETIQDMGTLTCAVLGLDLVYIIVLRFFYKQMTYTMDFLLLLVLNISVIFQSCFGGVGFAQKHYITCIVALICCQVMFLLTRNHIRLMAIKKYLYIVLGVLMLAILFLTGSRSMWIQIGSISIQPSEFMKPVFVLLCATSIMEQHEKKKILFFYISKEAMCLTVAFLAIFLLQWWCRDLGSLPTFAAAYGCAVICRICYPKAKFSKKAVIILCSIGAVVVLAALKFAPGYVQDRLSADIWNDIYGHGYQQCRALMAIAEGGLFGKGPGYGDLIEVAAADTDIVFSTICEEWGFLVALLVIFFIVSLLILPMINKPRSYYHTTMVLGVAAVFVVQMGLNIFGSCNLIPFTGVTIPFISQGGSSMMTCGLLAGMLKAGQSPVFRKPEVLTWDSDAETNNPVMRFLLKTVGTKRPDSQEKEDFQQLSDTQNVKVPENSTNPQNRRRPQNPASSRDMRKPQNPANPQGARRSQNPASPQNARRPQNPANSQDMRRLQSPTNAQQTGRPAGQDANPYRRANTLRTEPTVSEPTRLHDPYAARTGYTRQIPNETNAVQSNQMGRTGTNRTSETGRYQTVRPKQTERGRSGTEYEKH